ncbi:FHA domain-containing protein [Actinomyces dentalis]|uniref:FHA domain-containing protein n=1 Tax=Actinomyces dentalis TaxID=272548 RepID=UPI00041B9934|nr:FHA domain-containing protein [Actinomyces dentalis]
MNPVPQWSPGRIPVAVSGGGVIALDDEPALVVRLWEAMEAGAPLADLLRELAGAHGGDVFSLPDFLAAVHEPDGLRVAARGRFRLVAHGPAGRDVVHAPGAIAWEETVLRADAVELLLDDDAGAPGGERLPLRSGVVRAGALHWSAVPGSAPAPSCGPARTAPETDEPAGPDGPAGPAEPDAPVAAASPAAVPEPAGPAAPRPAAPRSAGSAASPAESAASPDAPASPAPVPGGALTLGPEDLDAVLDAPPEPPSPDPARPGPGAAGAAPGAAGADDSPSLADAQAEFGHHFLSRPGGPPSPAEPGGPVGADPAPSAPGLIREVPAPDLILEVPSPSPAPTPAPRAEDAEDWVHDGRTVSPAQLRAMREAAGAGAGRAPADGADTVLAVLCDQGHPNAVHAVSCRRCGGRLQTDSLRVPRPLLGRLRASTGAVVDLRHDVVVGRAPAATPRPGRPSPELLIITDADKSASKVHCAVRVEDWDLAVEDLGSSNGTFLLRPGRAPRRLAPHSPEPLAVGDVISLADAATLTVEDADE